MKVVYWKDHETGDTGHGNPVQDAEADDVVSIMNQKYPHIQHHAETVV